MLSLLLLITFTGSIYASEKRTCVNIRQSERRLSVTPTTNPLTIHFKSDEEYVDIVNMRGLMDAQNLDDRTRKSCWDRIMARCYGERKPTHIERTDSYYPDRGQSPHPFNKNS
jgi:hypothetical protein